MGCGASVAPSESKSAPPEPASSGNYPPPPVASAQSASACPAEGRHAIWVDSDKNISRSADPLREAGITVHFFNETADCLAALGKQVPTSGECLVVVITSMMRRNGRKERGLMDGLHLLDTIRLRMQKEANASHQPLFAVISASADKQECVDHGVDVLVVGDRIKFQRDVLAALNSGSDRSWRTEHRAQARDCKQLFGAAQTLKRELEQECWQKHRQVADELLNLSTDHCFCDVCEPKKEWTRAGQKYVLPINWFRLGLSLREEYLNRRSEIETWPVAYHGSGRHVLLSIMRHQRLMFPGDTLLDGTVLKIKCNNCWADRVAEKDQPVIYVSPSVIYAGAPYYATPFELGGRMAQAIFQVRVKPSSINKFPETLRNKYNDPEFSREELEWVIADRNAVVPYGLLVRYTDEPETPDSLWVAGESVEASNMDSGAGSALDNKQSDSAPYSNAVEASNMDSGAGSALDNKQSDSAPYSN